MIMEDKLLKEINRFREISKLPLLTEQVTWLDNLISAGTKRFSSLDDVISKLGYKNVDLTDNEIDNIADELKLAGLTDEMAENVRNVLKNDANVRKALTMPSTDFVTALKNASNSGKKVSGFDVVKTFNPAQIKSITKNLVTKFLNDETSNLSKALVNLDTTISGALQKIYDNGQILYSVDEMYDVFDGFINKLLSENGFSDDLAEEVLQSFKTKYRSSSKTKELLDKFKSEGRTLNKPSRATSVSKYDNTNLISDDWLSTKKWKALDDSGVPIQHTSTPVDNNLPVIVDDTINELEKMVDEAGGGDFEAIDWSTLDPDEVVEDVLDPNFFNKYGGDIDFEFLEAAQWLKERIGATNNVTLKKVLTVLKKGKRMSVEDFAKIQDELKGLLGSRYDIISERLLAPKFTKLNLLKSFYWRTVEPLVRKFREAFTPQYFERVAINSGIEGGANFDFYFNNFKNRLETYMLTFDPKNATIGELRKLKDDFLRLRSAGVENNMYYDKLWTDLDDYIRRNLDEVSLRDWEAIVKKIQNEKGSNWRYMTWKEVMNDPTVIKTAENASVGSKKGNFSPGQIVEDITLKVSKSFWSKYKNNIFSYFMTGNIKTPKQMQEYLVKNGYAKSGMNGIFNLSAGGANFLSMTMWRYVYLPMVVAAFSTLYNVLVEGTTKTEMNKKEWYDHFLDSLWDNLSTVNWMTSPIVNEEFKKYAPEWYEWFKPIISSSAPVFNIAYTVIASASSKYPTQEERAHDYVDSLISDIEKTLSPDNKISKETLDIWKKSILGPMVRDVSIYNLPKETADNVVANMESVVSVDPLLKNEIHTYISELAKKGTVTDKFSALKEINAKYKDRIIGSAVTDIIVKTPRKKYKLVDSHAGDFSDRNGKKLNGIVFVTPDYETLKKGDLGTKIEYHPLNELKF